MPEATEIFAFTDYKVWLAAIISHKSERGFKARLATAAGCQRSFLSQVLNGSAHLTLDHAIGIAVGLKMLDAETDYLEAMVGLARSAANAAQVHFRRKMTRLAQARTNLATRFAQPALTDAHLAMGYYSSWHYAVLHMLITVPGLITVESLSQRLNLSAAETESALESLEKWGVIRRASKGWVALSKSVHIPREHPMTAVHHRNFRHLAANTEVQGRSDTLQYSAVYSLDARAFAEIREAMFRFIDETRGFVVKAIEEDVAVLNLDFFAMR